MGPIYKSLRIWTFVQKGRKLSVVFSSFMERAAVKKKEASLPSHSTVPIQLRFRDPLPLVAWDGRLDAALWPTGFSSISLFS